MRGSYSCDAHWQGHWLIDEPQWGDFSEQADRTVGTRQLESGSCVAMLDDDHKAGCHGWLTGRKQTPGLRKLLTLSPLSACQAACQQFRMSMCYLQLDKHGLGQHRYASLFKRWQRTHKQACAEVCTYREFYIKQTSVHNVPVWLSKASKTWQRADASYWEVKTDWISHEFVHCPTEVEWLTYCRLQFLLQCHNREETDFRRTTVWILIKKEKQYHSRSWQYDQSLQPGSFNTFGWLYYLNRVTAVLALSFMNEWIHCSVLTTCSGCTLLWPFIGRDWIQQIHPTWSAGRTGYRASSHFIINKN